MSISVIALIGSLMSLKGNLDKTLFHEPEPLDLSLTGIRSWLVKKSPEEIVCKEVCDIHHCLLAEYAHENGFPFAVVGWSAVYLNGIHPGISPETIQRIPEPVTTLLAQFSHGELTAADVLGLMRE